MMRNRLLFHKKNKSDTRKSIHTVLDLLISISIITEALGVEYAELVYDILESDYDK